jgi:hypothetical protein
MTGRSLHDTLLRVLSHGPLRAQLYDPHDGAMALKADEWQILRCVPPGQLRNMARFLARHYYGERIVRLFRHARRLAAQTGRDPLLLLDSARACAVLDDAVLGSPGTAEEMVSLIETFLLADAGEIQHRFPYWQDLVLYQATMFRLEARPTQESATSFPRRSATGKIVQFEWDMPAIFAGLESMHAQQVQHLRYPSLLLIASSSNRQVTSLRCSPNVKRLFEAADGTRTVEELAMVAGFSVRQTEQILKQMKQIGAIH